MPGRGHRWQSGPARARLFESWTAGGGTWRHYSDSRPRRYQKHVHLSFLIIHKPPRPDQILVRAKPFLDEEVLQGGNPGRQFRHHDVHLLSQLAEPAPDTGSGRSWRWFPPGLLGWHSLPQLKPASVSHPTDFRIDQRRRVPLCVSPVRISSGASVLITSVGARPPLRATLMPKGTSSRPSVAWASGLMLSFTPWVLA